MRRLVGSILVIIAAVCFGFMGLFGSWATNAGVTVEMMLFLRFAIAGAAMATFMAVRGLPWPRGRVLVGLIGMGGVLYVGEAMFYFHAAKYIPVGLVSLLLYVYPIIVTLFAWLVLHERLTMGRIVALGLALGGLGLTIGPIVNRELQTSTPGAHALRGVALGLLCCMSYAIYILCGPSLTRRAGAIPAATVVILSAAAVLGAIALGKGEPLPAAGRAWLGIALLAVLSTVVAITAVLAGLERIGAVQTSTLSTLEPVATVLVGTMWLGESLVGWQLVGGGLIVLAAMIVARSGKADDDSNTPQ